MIVLGIIGLIALVLLNTVGHIPRDKWHPTLLMPRLMQRKINGRWEYREMTGLEANAVLRDDMYSLRELIRGWVR
jgi:hypothetical protein